MLLDGRELKGESITFLGEFATAPANPKNGDSYRNTTDRATYIYQDGRWQLMISDGKDGKDYEYIYTRGNIIDNPPENLTASRRMIISPKAGRMILLVWTQTIRLNGVVHVLRKTGVWSEFSTPTVVHRWSKDGENAIMADFDNEMVNAALLRTGRSCPHRLGIQLSACGTERKSSPLTASPVHLTQIFCVRQTRIQEW